MSENQASYSSGKALEAILTDRPIVFYPSLAKKLGDIKAALFLAQLAYWTPKAKDPDGWVYKTQAEWEEETALTRREQEHAREVLKDQGILLEKRIGMPAQLYYQIDWDALTSLHESASKIGGKRTSINKEPETTTETTTETTSSSFADATEEGESPEKPKKNTPNPLVKTTMDTLESVRGFASGNYGAEAKAVKQMLTRSYEPETIIRCYQHLKADHFWASKALSMMTVATQIGEWRKSDQTAQSPPAPSQEQRDQDHAWMLERERQFTNSPLEPRHESFLAKYKADHPDWVYEENRR